MLFRGRPNKNNSNNKKNRNKMSSDIIKLLTGVLLQISDIGC